MKWKDFPAWLKGGIIGVIIGILTFLVAYFYQELKKPEIGFLSLSEKPIFIRILIFFPFFISTLILSLIGIGSRNQNPIIIFFLGLIVYFLIGAFIGWIVGKIKSKKKS